MTSVRTRVDRLLLGLIAAILLSGILIFASAAFGLLARGNTNITSVFINHLGMGVGLGLAGMLIGMSIDYTLWRRYAVHIFVLSLIATALVFVPHIGLTHGGGRRWILIWKFSLQPSEFLKPAGIILAAAYCALIKNKITTLKYGLGGMLGILALPALLLVAQPDLGTLSVICVGIISVFIVAGARWSHIALLSGLAVGTLVILALLRPYVMDRIETFIHPSQGQQGQSYQLKQSLIAIGSGEIIGRGLGQGIQKFTYLPEPMGDSIFAVLGEELGFFGAVGLILLYLTFALRAYTVSARAPDAFGAYVGHGITTYFLFEAFVNISSMIGIAPLTGIPLTFISQGGSAMLVSLASAGILLRISRKKIVHHRA